MTGLRVGSVVFPHYVFMGPGLRGFFGEGYWFHSLFRFFFGDIWKGMNFVAKTTTLARRAGNMPLRRDGYRMRGVLPRCILVKPFSGHILNAVGLSGPGFGALLDKGLWQERNEPWVLSFMAVGQSDEERTQEYNSFAGLLGEHLNGPPGSAPLVLQLNFGCPNAEIPLETLHDEILAHLRTVRELGLPVMLNFNPLVPAEILLRLQNSGLVDCFWIANTIPYHTDYLGEILFGKELSPMRRHDFNSDGGISGPLCLPYTVAAVKAARAVGVDLPIIAGNGIQSVGAVRALKDAGANAIAMATAAIVRPWLVQHIVRYANEAFTGGVWM